MDSSNASEANLTQASSSRSIETVSPLPIPDLERRLIYLEASQFRWSRMVLDYQNEHKKLLEEVQLSQLAYLGEIQTLKDRLEAFKISLRTKVSIRRKSKSKSLATCPPTNSRRMKR